MDVIFLNKAHLYYSMRREDILKTIASKLKKAGARKIAIFGSYARKEEKKIAMLTFWLNFLNRNLCLNLLELNKS